MELKDSRYWHFKSRVEERAGIEIGRYTYDTINMACEMTIAKALKNRRLKIKRNVRLGNGSKASVDNPKVMVKVELFGSEFVAIYDTHDKMAVTCLIDQMHYHRNMISNLVKEGVVTIIRDDGYIEVRGI